MEALKKSIFDINRALKLWDVWSHHAYYEISAKYKRTFLGPIWIVGQALSLSIALAIMMGSIQGQNLPDVLPYVMGGTLTWNMVNFVFSEGAESFMSRSGMIKNHNQPFMYYILESASRVIMVFLHNIIVFFAMELVLQKFVLPNPEIIIGLALIAINMVTWGTLSAMASARFRDMRFLLPFVGQIVFFLTPVFWRPSVNHDAGIRAMFYDYNPFYAFVEIVRSPLIGAPVSLEHWVVVAWATVLGIAFWLTFFTAFRKKIAFWV